ncbi:helix-turn-helix domain-containing protein [Actinophytocola sp.]|uniref:helix-turn-helix domain-containing protein n=1 Tax=Actinophytocola sp. TaxID=1872138 RepID=UPI00389AF06B
MPDYVPDMRMRRIARTLLHWRESRGINGTDIAKQAGWSASKQSRLENAIQPAQPSEVITLALLYGVPEAERDAVFNSCVAAQQKGWWDEISEEALVADLVDYFEFESEATTVRTFKIDLVPGLMQTAGYAAAIESAGLPQVSAEVVRERVEARIKRQERLNGEKQINIQAVLTEGALRSQVGGPEVMREQLDRLVEISTLPNVDLRVIAATGAYPAMGSPFSILSFAHAYPDVGYVELINEGVYIEEPEVLERYEVNFTGLKAVALDPRRSRNLIAKIAKSLT